MHTKSKKYGIVNLFVPCVLHFCQKSLHHVDQFLIYNEFQFFPAADFMDQFLLIFAKGSFHFGAEQHLNILILNALRLQLLCLLPQFLVNIFGLCLTDTHPAAVKGKGAVFRDQSFDLLPHLSETGHSLTYGRFKVADIEGDPPVICQFPHISIGTTDLDIPLQLLKIFRTFI